MNTIKFKNENKILLNGVEYKPYVVGNLPPTFGQKHFIDHDENNDMVLRPGISQWFNFKGFTYVQS